MGNIQPDSGLCQIIMLDLHVRATIRVTFDTGHHLLAASWKPDLTHAGQTLPPVLIASEGDVASAGHDSAGLWAAAGESQAG